MRCSVLDLGCDFQGDGLAEVIDFIFWWQDFDVHPLNCCPVVSSAFDVVLEIIFVGCRCKPCAVVAVMRSSVVVCLPRFHFPVSGFVMFCKSELKKSVSE